jgi:hypothetical protein
MLPGFSFNDLSHGPSFSYDPRFPMDNHYYGLSVADNFTYVRKNHQMKLATTFVEVKGFINREWLVEVEADCVADQ